MSSRRIGGGALALRAVGTVGTVGAVAAGVVLGVATPAAAQDWQVTSYHIGYDIGRDGIVHVKETIRFDFGTRAGHGIDRSLHYLDPEKGGTHRRYDIDNLRISSPSGAPSRSAVTDTGTQLAIRVGDPHRTVTGVQTYVIAYDLGRALTPVGDHAELTWDPVGEGWQVPIADLAVRITAPGRLSGPTCTVGSRRYGCDRASTAGDRADFVEDGLRSKEGVRIRLALATAGVTIPDPSYVRLSVWQELSNAVHSFVELSTRTLAVAVGCLVAVVALFLLLQPRVGRARTPRQLTGPPDGVRPAEAGLLVAGQPGHVLLTATLVDLTVRGHLRVESAPAHKGMPDWQLAQVSREPPGPDPDLTTYEQVLMRALFRDRDAVLLSEVKSRFREAMRRFDRQLVKSAVRRRWYRWRPDVQNGLLVIAGLGAITAGVTYGFDNRPAVGGVLGAASLCVAGILVCVIGRKVVPRTVTGDGVRRQVLAFGRYLSDPGVRRGPDQLGEQLPYAVALLPKDEWEQRFGAVDEGLAGGGRDAGGVVAAGSPYATATFAAALIAFAASLHVTVSDNSGSAVSGSDGGGGGGGGGGGW